MVLEVNKMLCSAGARSCHKRSRHLPRRSGAEVVCCTTQGGAEAWRPWSKHAGSKRQIKVRPHPLSSTCHTPAGSAKGWTKSDNGRDVMVRVPWLCLGLYRSDRESSSGSIRFHTVRGVIHLPPSSSQSAGKATVTCRDRKSTKANAKERQRVGIEQIFDVWYQK